MARVAAVVSVLALPVFLASAAWLGVLDREGPPHAELMLEGGVPATLYLPGPSRGAFLDPVAPERRPPAVVAVHGLGGDRLAMSGLSRRLAASGFAVLAIDARGHGANRNPYVPRSAESPFYADLAAAVDALRTSPWVDGSRVALLGDSLGAAAVLDYATRDSGIDATVMLSGGLRMVGPYRPANALFVYTSRDPAWLRERGEALAARLAGASRVEAGRSYGDSARGTGVRVAELPRAHYQTILWMDAAVREITSWLDAAFGVKPRRSGVPDDPRATAGLLVALSALLLLPGIGAVVGRVVPRGDQRPRTGAAVGLLVLTLVMGATLPLMAVGAPGGLFAVEVGDVVVAHLALVGLVMLLVLAAWERVRFAPLGRGLGWTLFGAALAVVALFVMANAASPVLHRVALTPERMLVFSMVAFAVFPYTLALQLLLRRGRVRAATIYSVAGRAVLCLALVVGAELDLLSGLAYALVLPLAIAFVYAEVLATALYAAARNLVAIAVVDAAWLALVLAAFLPVRI